MFNAVDITHNIPQKDPYDSEGRWRKNNLAETVVTMTRDEAVELITGLVSFLNESPNRYGSCPIFADGPWQEKRIVFSVVCEQAYIENIQRFRREVETAKEESSETPHSGSVDKGDD